MKVAEMEPVDSFHINGRIAPFLSGPLRTVPSRMLPHDARQAMTE
jgi:hypothetical protein